jgi:2,4-dienoyl-CoA reductase-like NADH-dependent reductase (Old Yellow Enzyme family)
MNPLFSPLEIKGLTLKNRLVLPPMATEKSAPEGLVTPDSITYYGTMAERGMALLIVEHNFVSPEGKASPGQMSIARDADLAGHSRICRAIHDADTPTALQISHAGSNHQESLGPDCQGASPVAHPGSGLVPRELGIKDIADLVSTFGRAAARGKSAGYDLVEIHAAHGYLLSQFLSPLTNQRGDRYGGSAANRRRLLLEIIEETRCRVGEDYPLMLRLGISDIPPGLALHRGGLSLEEGIQAARCATEAGIDLLDISGGLGGSRPAGISGEGYFLPWMEALRPAVKVPLLLTGGITSPAGAGRVLQSGWVDLVGVGRALAADPDWVVKARSEV